MMVSFRSVETNNANTPAPPRAAAGIDLPDAFAPMIRNAWYVIANRNDVGRELLGIKVLGEPLVAYRTEAGDPIVLDDRCAHRRFKLSASRLVGDTIQCGYHGFTYDQTGACVWAPGINVKPKFGVRAYAVAEVGPWLWVWMGDAEVADFSTVPYPVLDRKETWHQIDGYKHNPGNYMLLIENFLDLTHLHFLHGAEVSDLTQANTLPKSVPQSENCVGWIKETARAPSGLFATIAGADSTKIVRIVTFESQLGPSLNYGYEDRYALDGEEELPYPLRFHVIHAITPQDRNNTHQFFQISFNNMPVEGLAQFRDFSRDVVFEQDVTAIAYMQEAINDDCRKGPVEFGIPSDRFGIAMRRILRRMHASEAI